MELLKKLPIVIDACLCNTCKQQAAQRSRSDNLGISIFWNYLPPKQIKASHIYDMQNWIFTGYHCITDTPMLGVFRPQGLTDLVKADFHHSWTAFLTHFLGHADFVCIFEKVYHHIASGRKFNQSSETYWSLPPIQNIHLYWTSTSELDKANGPMARGNTNL